MSFLRVVEDFLEQWVEGWFGRRFKGPLQPQEVARKAVKAMLKNQKASINKIYVPNFYEIALSQDDWNQFAAIQEAFSAEVGEVLVAKARERNLTLLGKPQVRFRVDSSIPQGTIQIKQQFVEPPKEEKAEQEKLQEQIEDTLTFNKQELLARTVVKGGWLLRVIRGSDEGKCFRLEKGKYILGRNQENDIVLNDSNISRIHAQIEYVNGYYFLNDLGSTNGTFLNGRRINKGRLHPGDKIVVGRTELQFEEG